MKEKLYRFEVANKGIYEAVDLACPRTDTRRNSKPDGAWLPKVGERFPGAVSYWTEFGLWHYLNSGLYNWHSSVVDGEVTVLVSSRPEKPLYSDEFQVIDLSDKFNVSQNLLPAHLENRKIVPYIDKPHYAVVFSSVRTQSKSGYEDAAKRMMNLAATQPGYLGFESARESGGVGISISYWDSPESITNWKKNSEHLAAQESGRTEWYSNYTTRICKVDRGYNFGAVAKPIQSSIELRSDRISVQPFESSGAQQVLDYFIRNKEHLAPTDPPHPAGFHTLGFWEERIARSRMESTDESAFRFVLKLPTDDKRIVGTVNLTQVFKGPFQACYLGYGIDRDHEGKGLMTEALKLVIGFAFGKLNLHRIMANHLVENTRSAALLKKLGFQQEGIAKEYLYISGAWKDHVLNSLTNSNWKNTLEKTT